jgi:hypothetical protein
MGFDGVDCAGEEDAVEDLGLDEAEVERKRCRVEALGKARGRRKGRYFKAFVCVNAIVNKFDKQKSIPCTSNIKSSLNIYLPVR